MKTILTIFITICCLQSLTKADDISEDKIKNIIIAENFPVFAKSENNWIQKKEKDKWITKKDTKKWITKKAGTTNDLAYITLLPLAIIIIYIKRTFR